MKREKAIKLAVKDYEKDLRNTGTSKIAIDNAVVCGLSFVRYYEKYKKKKEHIKVKELIDVL